MTISAAVLDAMIAAGATAEVIAAAVKVDIAENEVRIEARIERKRAGNAERQRRFREARNASNALQGVSNALSRVTEAPIKEHARVHVDDSSSSSVGTGYKQDSSLRSQCAREEDTPEFMEFWNAYPNRVGKPAARLKFQKALEKAGLADILAGLQRYIRDKPADRQWLNPATFLHQERWSDQPLFVNGHAHDPPRKLRGSAALSELARRPFEEVFPNVRSFNRS